MGLKYYFQDVNNSDGFSPLYANTGVSYYKTNYYPSRPPSSEIPIIKIYNDIIPSTHLQKSIYANVSILSPTPTDISSESSYTTSITFPSKIDVVLDENNNRVYENVNLRPASSSLPVYINLEHPKDLPTPSLKTYQNKKVQNVSIDHETNILETSIIQTVKKFEINMAPNCGDKSVLYRTKIPAQIRRTSYRSRRHRRRSSTPFRTIHQRRQQQQHSLHKTSQMKSVSNKLYNEVHQSMLSNNHIVGELFECPMEFHGLLQPQFISWYPTENYNEEQLIPQVFSASENVESNQQDETTSEGEEEEEEQEELFPHDTFEDFFLRRPPKSSSSDTDTITSEIDSYEIPVKPKAPPPPPLPPLPSNQSRRLASTRLRLDKNDVDFIHNIIKRTNGDDRLSNRITALREAYIRAESKRNELQQTKKKMPIQHSFVNSKIRHELERYDELPIHRRAFTDDDDDDDDDTYSANDDRRINRRTLPRVPSTTHRILNFLITLKRQLQKNFQDIRSRILIETMANPSTRHRHSYHSSSALSHRHTSRSKTPHNTNSHHSIEHSYPIHRQALYRTHSNMSQLQSHRPRTFRVTPHLQRRQRLE